jgi:hypothetical protein
MGGGQAPPLKRDALSRISARSPELLQWHRTRWPERLETDLELNRSTHHWDEGSWSLSPEDRVCAAVEVVE